jgi:hypothetical protein
LTAAGTKKSLRTVQRMRARYRDQGLWGLVDERSARGSTPTGNVDERVVYAARTVIAAQTGTSTGTRSRVVDRIRDLLDELHGPGAVELPSRTTLYRLLDTLSKGRHTFGTATTRRTTALKPDGVYTATRVNNFIDPPVRLLDPFFISPVATVNLRRRQGDTQRRQFDGAGRADGRTSLRDTVLE